MTAFNPISAGTAASLIESTGISDGMLLIANLAEAGLVKAYASYMEKVQPSGVREVVRNKRIEPQMWRRIIQEGKVADLSSGAVRLEGSSEFGGGPKTTLIGVRFSPDCVAQAAREHALQTAPVVKMLTPPLLDPGNAASKLNVEASAPIEQARPIRLSECTDLLSIDETAAVLHCGRSKVYALIEAGELDKMKLGKSSRVTRVSVERYLERSGSGPFAVEALLAVPRTNT